MKFFGPLPVFHDRRSNDARASGAFPKSQLVKKFISRSMLSCTGNPVLTPDDIQAMQLDANRLPSRPHVPPMWPDIPPDAVQAPSASRTSGKTPHEAVQQIKGWFYFSVEFSEIKLLHY